MCSPSEWSTSVRPVFFGGVPTRRKRYASPLHVPSDLSELLVPPDCIRQWRRGRSEAAGGWRAKGTPECESSSEDVYRQARLPTTVALPPFSVACLVERHGRAKTHQLHRTQDASIHSSMEDNSKLKICVSTQSLCACISMPAGATVAAPSVACDARRATHAQQEAHNPEPKTTSERRARHSTRR